MRDVLPGVSVRLRDCCSPAQCSCGLIGAHVPNCDGLASIDDEQRAPIHGSKLYQATYDPASGVVQIAFDLLTQSPVNLTIYDISGRSMVTLIDDQSHDRGRHEFAWDLRDESHRKLPTGVYFYRISTQEFSDTKRIVLVK